jgi:hypothetical protein
MMFDGGILSRIGPEGKMEENMPFWQIAFRSECQYGIENGARFYRVTIIRSF